MKRLMILDEPGTTLLSDTLNQRIVRELVLSPYSSTELSRKLRVPPVKMWRRMSKLLQAKVIEQTSTDYVGNLEKKIYRAAALRYLPQYFLQFEPKHKSLREAYKSYAEIQQEIMRDIATSNELPDTGLISPVDYGVYADLRGYCRTMLNPRIQAKIQRLEKLLSNCKEFEDVVQILPRK